MTRIVVTGGRDYEDRELVFIVLDRAHKETPISLLVHGACGWDRDVPPDGPMRGADRWAHEWAIERRVPVRAIPARWRCLGRGAGPRRNREMLDLDPDRVLAFPGEIGTWNCIKQARGMGIGVEHCARTTEECRAALLRDRRDHYWAPLRRPTPQSSEEPKP